MLTVRNLMLSLCIGELSHTGTVLPSFNASPVSAPRSAPRSADSSQMLTVNSILLSRQLCQLCQLSRIKSSDWRIAARGTSAFPSALNKALKDCHQPLIGSQILCAVQLALLDLQGPSVNLHCLLRLRNQLCAPTRERYNAQASIAQVSTFNTFYLQGASP
jgi:hypothetical protein